MTVCPNIIRKFNKVRHRTQYYHVLWNGDSGFEVREKKWRFTVDLRSQTCSCRYWQVSWIPCQHACAALFKMSEEPNNYIHMSSHLRHTRGHTNMYCNQWSMSRLGLCLQIPNHVPSECCSSSVSSCTKIKPTPDSNQP